MNFLNEPATTAWKGRKDLTLDVQAKLFDTIQTGWKLWVPAHIVNFAAVPSSQRVLYTNVVAVRSQHNIQSRPLHWLLHYQLCTARRLLDLHLRACTFVHYHRSVVNKPA